MTLKKLSEIKEASKVLSKYWEERGMPEYDEKWAEDYLKNGHTKEIIGDEFFVYEKQEIIGIVSLITDVSGVAEIRDMIIKPEYRNKGYGTLMLKQLIEIANERKLRKLFALVFPKHENFYKGFEKEGTLRNHFAEGETLSIMSYFIP
ncbi:MAG: GNAT family N-acetyltransferase [Bacteroidota bacterium]